MLSEQEKQEIELVLAAYPTRPTAAIDGLLVVQRHRGWVSDEALADLAAFLDMTPAELDGIATFYSRVYRKPTGDRVIAVCDSVSCYLLGGERLLERLAGKLGIRPGQTTPDGKVTLIPAVCLGHCERAPALSIDERVVGPITEERLDGLIDELRGPGR